MSSKTIEDAIARVAYVSNWADRQEEKGRSFSGQDLMQVAPRTTSATARRWGREVARRLVEMNRVRNLEELYIRARSLGFPHDEEHFGSDLGLQAMGHGVAWDDDVRGAVPRDAIRVPHSEFYG